MQYRQIFCFMQCRERLVPPRKSVLRLLPGQWILKHINEAGISGYQYTADYHAFSQYTQFLYDIYAENMIHDKTVNKKKP